MGSEIEGIADSVVQAVGTPRPYTPRLSNSEFRALKARRKKEVEQATRELGLPRDAWHDPVKEREFLLREKLERKRIDAEFARMMEEDELIKWRDHGPY